MKPLTKKLEPKGNVTPLNRPGFRPEPVAPKIKKKKPALYLFALLILYFIVLFSVQGIRYIQLSNEVKALDREIAAIKEENNALMKEIEMLSDPEYLEELARESLRMVKPGEVIFSFLNPEQQP
jgi:cell division protein FtsL